MSNDNGYDKDAVEEENDPRGPLLGRITPEQLPSVLTMALTRLQGISDPCTEPGHEFGGPHGRIQGRITRSALISHIVNCTPGQSQELGLKLRALGLLHSIGDYTHYIRLDVHTVTPSMVDEQFGRKRSSGWRWKKN